MQPKGISIEMPVGADAPLLSDGSTLNPFFGYITQSANRAGFKGVEVDGDRMWLRKITDVKPTPPGEPPTGFHFGLMMYLMQQTSANDFAMYGGPVEVHNYPTALKIALANKDDALPDYFGDVADVIDTPAVPAVIDEETGEVITPAVDATYRPARYSDLHGAKEQDGFLWAMNTDTRNYSKGSTCLRLAAEPGVTVVDLGSYPETPAPAPE